MQSKQSACTISNGVDGVADETAGNGAWDGAFLVFATLPFTFYVVCNSRSKQ